MSRRHTRHRPILRYTERGRPHYWHRLQFRTANFDLRAAFWISAVFAISVLLEREAEPAQQRTALVVVGRRGDHGDVHTPDPVDLVLVDLVEHGLLGQTEGVVAVPVELLGRESAEVADPRQREAEQAVGELPHPVPTQGGVGADRLALTELELRDGPAGPGHQRLLTGDRGQVTHPALDHRAEAAGDRKSTRLNSSHVAISYAVFCSKTKRSL